MHRTETFVQVVAIMLSLETSEPADAVYAGLCRHVLAHGEDDSAADERTGTGTLSCFGAPRVRYDLRTGFPLLTTKRVHFASMVSELLWFLSGSTNIRPLLQARCTIWSEWPYQAYLRASARLPTAENTLSQAEFERRIVDDEPFAARWGELGPVYGQQWRAWPGQSGRINDQVANVIRALRERPRDRGIILSAWNVDDLDRMALRPCHTLYQWKGRPDGRLDCVLYQRSADLMLGVPFNVASTALLTSMLAQVTGHHPGFLCHTFGDAHIYRNHVDALQQQLTRTPFPSPRLRLDPAVSDIGDFRREHISIEGYESHPAIKVPVAV